MKFVQSRKLAHAVLFGEDRTLCSQIADAHALPDASDDRPVPVCPACASRLETIERFLVALDWLRDHDPDRLREFVTVA